MSAVIYLSWAWFKMWARRWNRVSIYSRSKAISTSGLVASHQPHFEFAMSVDVVQCRSAIFKSGVVANVAVGVALLSHSVQELWLRPVSTFCGFLAAILALSVGRHTRQWRRLVQGLPVYATFKTASLSLESIGRFWHAKCFAGDFTTPSPFYQTCAVNDLYRRRVKQRPCSSDHF